jgi:hypothetical protein
MMKIVAVVISVAALATAVNQSSPSPSRPRTCCRYNNDNILCPDRATCLVRHAGGAILAPVTLDSCNVTEDSKKDAYYSADSGSEAQKCRNRLFGPKRSWPTDEISLPFSVRAYVFAGDDVPGELPAVEFALDYGNASTWDRVQFRIMNTAVCSSEDVDSVDETTDSCNPRCVTVERDARLATPTEAQLTYDCEAGFYTTFERRQIKETSGDTYQLDVCLDGTECGTFLFVMPELPLKFASLPLLDRVALVESRAVVLHTPGRITESVDDIQLVKAEDGGDVVVLNRTNGPSTSHKDFSKLILGEDDLNLTPGIYRLQFDGVKVAEFVILEEESSNVALGLILTLIFVALFSALSVYAYKRYLFVIEDTKVNPNRLRDSERIKPKNVFIITNVDNRHHINIVLDFNKYLKVCFNRSLQHRPLHRPLNKEDCALPK